MPFPSQKTYIPLVWLLLALQTAFSQEAGSAKVKANVFAHPVPPVADPLHPAIPLWPTLPPDAAPDAAPGTELAGEGNRIKNISVPTLIPYFPAHHPAHGTALIFCPGGGYGYVALGGPDNPFAARLNAEGVTVFILKYRQRGAKRAADLAFEDGQRAVRLVRSRAAEWGLDPARIGLAGSSAGANLTLWMMADFDRPAVHPPAADSVDSISARPDFAMLLSCWAGKSDVSPVKLGKNSPPLFMCHARNDTTALIGVSIDVANQLNALGVPVDYQEYDTGGHGAFNVRGRPPASLFLDRFLPWLRSLGKLDPVTGAL